MSDTPLWIEIIIKRKAVMDSFEEDLTARKDHETEAALTALSNSETERAKAAACRAKAYENILNIVNRYSKEYLNAMEKKEKRGR